MIKKKNIYLPDIIGKGYATFWNFKGRYRVCKGSRASKKSKTMALWTIFNIMKYHDANMLVIRKTYRTLKDSCFTDLKWAVHRLQVDNLWEFKESPLECTYKPTGQKILFRGLDDPLKVTSITVGVGCLCWMWIEEAYEVMSEADFDMLDESIRGETPEGLFKQITLTFNPWNEHHWMKKRFFDKSDPDTLALTTNYTCNEWLDASDIALFEKMKINNPRRYAVAGLGGWGIVDGLIYENWHEEEFTLDTVMNCKNAFGLDFGFTNDPTAFIMSFLDQEHNKLYVYDEIYEKGLSNKAIAEKLKELKVDTKTVTCDCAEPKSIYELQTLGIIHAKACKKGKDSVVHGIQWIQDLEIIIHPRCVNFLTEISNYTWDTDKFGTKINVPIDDFNHLMDAMRYGLERYMGNKWLM